MAIFRVPNFRLAGIIERSFGLKALTTAINISKLRTSGRATLKTLKPGGNLRCEEPEAEAVDATLISDGLIKDRSSSAPRKISSVTSGKTSPCIHMYRIRLGVSITSFPACKKSDSYWCGACVSSITRKHRGLY
ncbi:hypothetical protein KC349_g119 [Hortaea werneckii]|nr:hypothetical protein KC349_g119 [Hortaea werneckii]